jgi:hypothetical protein
MPQTWFREILVINGEELQEDKRGVPRHLKG